jgi:hypothetical protein
LTSRQKKKNSAQARWHLDISLRLTNKSKRLSKTIINPKEKDVQANATVLDIIIQKPKLSRWTASSY